jgi:hypothetical protein
MYQCAFAIAVYALLRVSEFTCPRTAEFDPSRQANLQDLQVFPNLEYPQYATLLIRTSKTDPFRNSHEVTIHATGQPDCPVGIVSHYLKANSHRAGTTPLFVLANGAFLTRGAVCKTLRESLRGLGLNDRAYAPHSFRIGGTVSLAAAGIPTYVLAILGRWASDSYLLYLKLTPAVLADVYRRLGKVTAANVISRGSAGLR